LKVCLAAWPQTQHRLAPLLSSMHKRVRMGEYHGRPRHARLWGSACPLSGTGRKVYGTNTQYWNIHLERGTQSQCQSLGHFGSRAKPLHFCCSAMGTFAVAIEGPVCSSADPFAGPEVAVYVVEWYSPAREAFLEFSRHNTRAEAEQTRARLFAIVAEVDRLRILRSAAAHANTPGWAPLWRCWVRPWAGV